jgi:hypothetical protein
MQLIRFKRINRLIRFERINRLIRYSLKVFYKNFRYNIDESI